MPNLRNRFPARRRFLKQSAALTATASLATPMLVVAQTAQASEAAADTAATSLPPATAEGAASATATRSPMRAPR